MTFNRNYVNGDIDLSGLTSSTKIYGKPSQFNENILAVANQLKTVLILNLMHLVDGDQNQGLHYKICIQ
jgi:hypothetical protein